MRPPRSPGTLPDGLRRLLLANGLGMALAPSKGLAQQAAGPAMLVFPRDHGSHPHTQTEWWYITGHTRVQHAGVARDIGFQLTFFRARVAATQGMRSRLAARQLLFAHAAVTDVQARRFWHDQRIARAGFEIAEASLDDTRIRVRDWSLVRGSDGAYTARLPAQGFGIDLRLTPTRPLLLQGVQGLSRKGSDPRHFSHYYSQPQMAFEGHVRLQAQRIAVRGEAARNPSVNSDGSGGAAWYDHEWSDGLMPDEAVGWDWIGMNLFDGGALMAFQMRDAVGHALWDAGSWRPGSSAPPAIFAPGETTWSAQRHWTSPLTQARYPTLWQLRTPAGDYSVHALMEDQELDSRGSTGAVYWEGLSELRDARGQPVGRGYLEMTGYAKKLVL